MRKPTRLVPGMNPWYKPPPVPAAVVTYRGDDAALALLSTTERERRTYEMKTKGTQHDHS